MGTSFIIILLRRNQYRIISIIITNKKAVFRELQRRRATIDEIPNQNIKRIHKKITSLFYHFAQIGKFTVQLFCTSEISSLIQAHSTYNKYCKKIPQDWPIYLLTDILSALSLTKKYLEKFEKKMNFAIDDLIEIFFYKKNYKDKEIKFLKLFFKKTLRNN